MNRFTDRLKQVLRRLGRTRMFAAITLITLAVGVGANTVIFSVVEGVLLKPLAYPDADRLIGVSHSALALESSSLKSHPSSIASTASKTRLSSRRAATVDPVNALRAE